MPLNTKYAVHHHPLQGHKGCWATTLREMLSHHLLQHCKLLRGTAFKLHSAVHWGNKISWFIKLKFPVSKEAKTTIRLISAQHNTYKERTDKSILVPFSAYDGLRRLVSQFIAYTVDIGGINMINADILLENLSTTTPNLLRMVTILNFF